MIKPDVIRIVIKTISPVHIGSGVDYYPMDYLPDKDNARLRFYDKTALSEAISKDEAKFKDYCEIVKGIKVDNDISIERFYKFISPYLEKLPPQSSGWSCPLTPSASAKLTKGSTTPIAALVKNQYLKEPYIPGSAVKGMLKNIMYWKYYTGKKHGLNDKDFPERDKDPWRLVQVSDFLPVQAAWHVDKLVNLHKLKKDADSRTVSDIPDLSELVNAGSVFIGTLTFNNALHKEALHGNDDFSREVKKFFPEPLNQDKLRTAVKDYGRNLFDKENKVFNSGGNFALKKNFEKWWNLYSSGETYEKARFIKLGKHAGAISKMVYGGDDFFNGERNVFIPQQKDKTAKNDTQTTVWLSSDGIPLGWATMLIGMAEEGWNMRLEQREKFIKEPHNFIAPRAERQERAADNRDAIKDK